MGHTMVALATPELVSIHSEHGRALAWLWPMDAQELVQVASMESNRERSGLHRSHKILHFRNNGEIALVAEVNNNEVVRIRPPDLLEIWTCPLELRRGFRPDVMAKVLQDMVACQADWSYATAARAVLSSAGLVERERSEDFREEVEDSWAAAPICTSVVITFWQRYLQGLAVATGVSDLALILRWMPLKADRGLPSELRAAMQRSGWRRLVPPHHPTRISL